MGTDITVVMVFVVYFEDICSYHGTQVKERTNFEISRCIDLILNLSFYSIYLER